MIMHIQPHQSPCLFRFLVAASHKLRINHSMKNNMYTRYTKKHTLYLQKNLLLPFIHSTWEGYSVIHGKLGMHTGVGSHLSLMTQQWPAESAFTSLVNLYGGWIIKIAILITREHILQKEMATNCWITWNTSFGIQDGDQMKLDPWNS
jgi:hypothetical protein